MLRGNYTARIDAKGRLKVPTPFRRLINEQHGSEFYVTSLTGEHVRLYALPEWESIEQRLSLLPSMDPARRKFLDRTNYYGQQQTMDAQGRVLIHPLLRKSAEVVGDVVVLPIPLTIPATRDARRMIEHPEIQAECRLIVRLADNDETQRDPRLNHVGFTRGRGMITRYVTKSNVVVGARPFHAVFLAGTLVGDGLPEVAVEQFLRLAEPPAHDTWEFNDDLRELYARGAGIRLKEMYDRVTSVLQQVLLPAPSREPRGPEALRKLLQLRTASRVREHSPARIRRVDAQLAADGAWQIRGEVVVDPSPRSLRVTPRLSFQVEGGAPVPIEWLTLSSMDARVIQEGGGFRIAPKMKGFTFEGVSDRESHVADSTECGAQLDILTKVID